MDYSPRHPRKASTSSPEQAKKKDGTLVSRTKKSFQTRSDRHDALILRRPGKFVSSATTASRLVAGRVGCRAGLFKGMGEKMAQAFAGRTSCRCAIGADLARPLPCAQDLTGQDPSAGG